MAKKQRKKEPAISGDIPPPRKLPSYLGAPTVENKHLTWRFSRADLGGPFSCAHLSCDDLKQLWDKLRTFETKNAAELISTGSHPIPCCELEKEARDRLMEIHLDDLEEVYSFRMEGACRLFCMRYENMFCVLWWDAKHKACRSEKSHT
jgi:hypothetical protein